MYEDVAEKVRERTRRHKEDIYSNVYKGTEEDRFMTKKEVKEMAARLQQQASLSTAEDRPVSVSSDLDFDRVMNSPMSIEKIITDTMERNEQNDRTNKDEFFKVPEYRNNILSYLRDREVCIYEVFLYRSLLRMLNFLGISVFFRIVSFYSLFLVLCQF